MTTYTRSEGLPCASRALRLFVALELGALSVLTLVFLTYGPRDTIVHVALASLFLCYVGISTSQIKERIWGVEALPKGLRLRRASLTLSIVTFPILALCFVWHAWRGEEIDYFNLVLAGSLYFIWALMQQTIFQFFLLGRLLTLMPTIPAGVVVTTNGFVFGLVHLPDIDIAIFTVTTGVFWSYIYYRDRLLTPIAISHALLGTGYYYFIIGRDFINAIAEKFS